MSVHLRWEQACTVLHQGRRCTRPATELGGLCGPCWRSALPSTRDYLKWRAAWEADDPPAESMPMSPMPADWDIVRVAAAMLGD